ncbi:MAG: DNA/RNA non-specific endonuclease [Gemmatimonadaceae bacterium]|nr:DNA/RNA non-specific endonuclease [Gemmatimonadaceae bacterium]
MRRLQSRVVRPLVLSLAILSCAPENVVGPTVVYNPHFAALNSASTVVISQVYGGGGNSGATLKNDFIELFNRGTAPVNVSGWSVQYAASTGVFSTKTDLSGTIQPGRYLLVQEAAGAGGTVSLPAPDVTGTIAMGGTGGKVALVMSATAINCGSTTVICTASQRATIADLVGYGSGPSFYEGTGGTASVSNSTAAARKDGGCTDTDNNAADFTVGAPAPRNSATAERACDSGPVEPAGPVATVAVTPAGSTVFLGSTRVFSATGTDATGRSSATTFTWTSSNTAVLAFADPSSGLASTPGGQGTVTVTATAANGVTGTTTAFVTEPGGVASISISINTPRQIPVGYTKPAFPTSRDASGTTISPPPALAWSSSNDAVATVDNLGYITGISVGTVTIRATAVNGVYGTNSITILPATAATTANYGNHVEFGTPTDGTPSDDYILTKPQYVLSYNRVRGGPNWVSWTLNASHFGAAPRCACFSADLTLPDGYYRVVDFDYRNGGYDRGHMVQSEPRTTTDQENASTFLLTNILPQAGENNQGPWSQFENYLNDLARTSSKQIYVVTGGEYAAQPGTLKGEGKVQIPDYTWKVAVIMGAGQGLANVTSVNSLEVISVRMPNLITAGGPASAVGIRNVPWATYKTTVDAIEARIGYDLLSNLPNRIEQLVEGGHEPVAVFGGATTGVEGSSMSFNGGSSTDADGDILTYAWTFGDGSTGTGVAPNHTYADNGSYTVSLTVMDPSEGESTVARVVDVSNAKPVATSLTVNNIVSGGTVSALASFTDAGAQDSPWSYTFNWGSSNLSTGTTGAIGSVGSSRSFTGAGSYTVSFTVTDKDGGVSAVRSATFQVSRIQIGPLVSPGQVNIGNNGNGQVKVIVLGTSEIDASQIDAESARIGGGAADA